MTVVDLIDFASEDFFSSSNEAVIVCEAMKQMSVENWFGIMDRQFILTFILSGLGLLVCHWISREFVRPEAIAGGLIVPGSV